NLLHELPVVTRLCFTIQRDVADRIDAVPGDKAYGPLAVILQATTCIRRLARVPASAFWPAPQVESAMLRLDVQPRPLLDTPQRLARFTGLLRGAFHHRRKTLKSNLGRCLEPAALETAAGLVNLSRRPEELTVSEWIELARQTVLEA
ncbi:MAG: hypothetical protein GY778_24920, partial [bacterium]|nr:hypothetical protein [bacterium]